MYEIWYVTYFHLFSSLLARREFFKIVFFFLSRLWPFFFQESGSLSCVTGALIPPRFECFAVNCTALHWIPGAMLPLAGYNQTVAYEGAKVPRGQGRSGKNDETWLEARSIAIYIYIYIAISCNIMVGSSPKAVAYYVEYGLLLIDPNFCWLQVQGAPSEQKRHCGLWLGASPTGIGSMA